MNGGSIKSTQEMTNDELSQYLVQIYNKLNALGNGGTLMNNCSYDFQPLSFSTKQHSLE